MSVYTMEKNLIITFTGMRTIVVSVLYGVLVLLLLILLMVTGIKCMTSHTTLQ